MRYKQKFKLGEYAKLDKTLIKIVNYSLYTGQNSNKVGFIFANSTHKGVYWTEEYRIDKIENQTTLEVLFGKK